MQRNVCSTMPRPSLTIDIPGDCLQFAKGHPRYMELSERFAGWLVAIGGSQQGTASLAAATANLRLTCVAAIAGATMGTQEKKIPLSLTLDKVKLICERLFKVKVAEMLIFLRVSTCRYCLSYHSIYILYLQTDYSTFMQTPGVPVPEPLTDDSRDLAFYGACDNSELLIDAVNLVDKEREEKKERQELKKLRQALEEQQLIDKDSVKAIADDYY